MIPLTLKVDGVSSAGLTWVQSYSCSQQGPRLEVAGLTGCCHPSKKAGMLDTAGPLSPHGVSCCASSPTVSNVPRKRDGKLQGIVRSVLGRHEI